MSLHRNALLLASDSELLSHCEQKSYQGRGPGGQHRNRTYTGVELKLPLWNLVIRCCDDRSSQVNRSQALKHLRLLLALEKREPPPQSWPVFMGSRGHLNPTNTAYPYFIALSLDQLDADQGQHASCAHHWKLSSTAFLRLLSQEKSVWQKLNDLRSLYGLKPLKVPG